MLRKSCHRTLNNSKITAGGPCIPHPLGCGGRPQFDFMCIKKTCFSIGILLEYTVPIYVMLASPFVLEEKVGKKSIAALLLAMAGVYLVISPNGGFDTLEFSSDYFIGILSGLLA